MSRIDRPVGKIVYTQWLTPKAGIWTDVTVTRIDDDAFLVVGADVIHRRMLAWLRRHAEGGAYVAITDMTTARTLLTVQGPRSRELLSRLTTADLSNEAFPYLTAQEIEVGRRRGARAARDLPGRAGLGAAHPERRRAHASTTRCSRRAPTLACATPGSCSLNSLRLEKAYRDYALDIFNDDTLIDVGLDFTVAWDKPGGFIGREALVKQRDTGVRTSRMVQVLVDDPEPLLYGDEQLLPRRRARRREPDRRLRPHAGRQRRARR